MLFFVSVADIPPSIRVVYVGKDDRQQIKISPIDDVWDFDKLRQFVADLRRIDLNVRVGAGWSHEIGPTDAQHTPFGSRFDDRPGESVVDPSYARLALQPANRHLPGCRFA